MRVLFCKSAYKEEPIDSAWKIYKHIMEQYPVANEKQIRKVTGIQVS